MKLQPFALSHNSKMLIHSYTKLLILALMFLPYMAFAEGNACSDLTTDLTSFQGILKAISIGVVTIAVIFSGYQIAFAHKRVSEVAPIFIGAILIGAAGEIASLFITNGTTGCAGA